MFLILLFEVIYRFIYIMSMQYHLKFFFFKIDKNFSLNIIRLFSRNLDENTLLVIGEY